MPRGPRCPRVSQHAETEQVSEGFSEWARAVDAGHLVAACKKMLPHRQRGPWTVLCDNERFLEAAPARGAHQRANVRLWHIPARSPDLNPAEKMWAWLRRRLRAMDLADLRGKRPVISRAGLKVRVRALCRSPDAQRVGQRCAAGLRRVCQEVVRRRGAATKG